MFLRLILGQVRLRLLLISSVTYESWLNIFRLVCIFARIVYFYTWNTCLSTSGIIYFCEGAPSYQSIVFIPIHKGWRRALFLRCCLRLSFIRVHGLDHICEGALYNNYLDWFFIIFTTVYHFCFVVPATARHWFLPFGAASNSNSAVQACLPLQEVLCLVGVDTSACAHALRWRQIRCDLKGFQRAGRLLFDLSHAPLSISVLLQKALVRVGRQVFVWVDWIIGAVGRIVILCLDNLLTSNIDLLLPLILRL